MSSDGSSAAFGWNSRLSLKWVRRVQ